RTGRLPREDRGRSRTRAPRPPRAAARSRARRQASRIGGVAARRHRPEARRGAPAAARARALRVARADPDEIPPRHAASDRSAGGDDAVARVDQVARRFVTRVARRAGAHVGADRRARVRDRAARRSGRGARAAHQRDAARAQRGGDPPPGRRGRRHDPRVGRLIRRRRRADAEREGARRHPVPGPAAASAVITPRRTRLVRVPDLQAFRTALGSAAGGLRHADAVVVPTRAAARMFGAGVTRDELYDAFRQRLADPPHWLTAIERDVIAPAAARAAADAGAPPAFHLRPGLVAEMGRFYDQLRRQSQTVNRFEELIGTALGSDDLDRGAARMRQQTRFLADTFREYERRVAASGACDEHVLRDRLIREAAADPIRAVVVTVADWIADENGLY